MRPFQPLNSTNSSALNPQPSILNPPSPLPTPSLISPTSFPSSSSLLFIDPTVDDLPNLLSGVTAGTEVHILNSSQNAVTQITNTLLGREGISSIHIVSHGESGGLDFGAGKLNLSDLPQFASQIQSWKKALTNDADILLYGCDVADGELGKAFVNILSQLTGADVAASSDLTGSASQSGNWTLEVNTGEIGTSLAFRADVLANYQHILPVDLVSSPLPALPNDAMGGSLTTNTSNRRVVSSDGRYSVFTSSGANLVPNDNNNAQDVFVHDRIAGTVSLVSLNSSGTGSGNNSASNPVISANGRYVAFQSGASDLVAGVGGIQIYVRDLQTGTTVVASRANGVSGVTGNSTSSNASISDDGRYVAFQSFANNLSPGDINFNQDIFVRDLMNNTTVLASPNSSGTNGGSSTSANPLISGDGQSVVFVSSATDLTALADTNGTQDIFWRNLQTNTTQLVSRNSAGTGTGNSFSDLPVISSDGRYVAFHSYASNLTSLSDTNNTYDVFLFDAQAGTNTLLSINSSGTGTGNSFSYNPSISADGRYIAFQSSSINLSPLDPNSTSDIYIRDRVAGTFTLASVNNSNTLGNNSSFDANISADGRYVAFVSAANNLSPLDTNFNQDIFVRDLQSNTTVLVSPNSSGTDGGNAASLTPVISANGQVVVFSTNAANLTSSSDSNGQSDVVLRHLPTNTSNLLSRRDPSLPLSTTAGSSSVNSSRNRSVSADGRYVVFDSSAGNLVPNDNNNAQDVFVRDTQTNTVSLVSLNSSDTGSSNGSSSSPVISANGRYVAFVSNANNLVTGVGGTQVYVRDLQTGTTVVASRANGVSGVTGNSNSSNASISDDGRYVAFTSTANNLSPSDTNFNQDIFVRDLQNNTTVLASPNSGGTNGGSSTSFSPLISGDGQSVVFVSVATDLTALADTNGTQDIFRRNLQTNTTQLVSRNSAGTGTGNNFSDLPVISSDGRYVAFYSNASDLTSLSDTNNTYDVFLFDAQAGTNTLLSINSSGTGTGNSGSYTPSISADGRYIAFQSNASNLSPLDTNGTPDIYVRDRVAGTFTLASVNNSNTLGNNTSYEANISANGRYVAFLSYASNLSPLDTNFNQDVFVRDLQTGASHLISRNQTDSNGGNSNSFTPRIGADGRYVLFQSNSSDLVSNDLNGQQDVFGLGLSADPTVTLPGGTLAYTENDPATLIDPGATVQDPGSANLNGGFLRALFSANGTVDDRLAIRNQGNGSGQIGVSGSTITYNSGSGAVAIGTFTGGTGTTLLLITFNANATPEAAQALIRNLTYANVSENPSTAARTLNITLSDGSGGSTLVTKTINVTAVDDTQFFVTNTNDSGAGSLRQAILDANADPGAETITFVGPTFTDTTPDTISLTSGLIIDDDVTLQGTGATKLAIAGTGPIDNGFALLTINASKTASFSGLTLRDATYGIRNNGTIASFSNSVITNTRFEGINNSSGSTIALLTNSTISNVQLQGIYNGGTITTLSNSTISGNTSYGIYNDGTITNLLNTTFGFNGRNGIYNNGAIANLNNNTISSSQQDGIIIDGGTITNLSSSTVSGNLYSGIALVRNGTIANLINSTISGNGIDGIYLSNSGINSLINSTIAGNQRFGLNNDGGGTITTAANNLVAGNGSNGTANLNVVPLGATNLIGTFASVGLDPVLRNNGGLTQTHALLPYSPAANVGSNAALPQDTADLDGDSNITEPIPFDQRGTGFNRIRGGTVDVGAFEVQNDLPTSANNSVTFNEDTDYTFTAADFPFSDTDNGDSLQSVQITQLPTAGSLTLNGNAVNASDIITLSDITSNKLKFTPFANANGTNYASFQFKVGDGKGFSSSASTMTLNVTGVDDTEFVVINTNSGGAGSLRQAILDANADTGAETIRFNITGGGVQAINLSSALPEITEQVTIDGYTQAGATENTLAVGNNANLKIVLTDNGSEGLANGLVLTNGSNNSTIQGLVIQGFSNSAITIQNGSTGSTIRGNFIGTNVAGDAASANGYGVQLTQGASNNVIGGSAAGDRNLISGNTNAGINLSIGASSNLIQGNYIGTNASGTAAIANQSDGVQLQNSGSNNTLQGNVISGNGANGIFMTSTGTNQVKGNLIGTNAAGNAAIANIGKGIYISGTGSMTLGGSTVADRNVISGNGQQGITIDGNGGYIIQGNYIGTNASGTAAIANQSDGVFLNNVGSSTIQTNLISGNTGNGVSVVTGGGNQITGNTIGTNAAGDAAIGNQGKGISITNSGNPTIGGTTTADRNLISGNGQQGIVISGSGGGTIQGNYIGTNASGTAAIGNQNGGIVLDNHSGATIQTNLISGNNSIGVLLQNGSNGTQVKGNSIGTDITGTIDLGNTLDGIQISSSQGTTIGGSTVSDRNLISGNDRIGILLSTSANNNQIKGNYIGTNAAGTAQLRNNYDGVQITNSANNLIGGSAAGEGNLISGNGDSSAPNGLGIFIAGASAIGNQIKGNRIGTDVTGTVAIGNRLGGIQTQSATNTVIGGSTAGDRNLISGNAGNGIAIVGNTATDGINNQVQGNYVGTDITGTAALGNNGRGITITTNNNLIGGTNPGEGNVVAFNANYGVRVNLSTGNRILGNSVFSNGTLGIELAPDNSVTPNDLGDGDTGANNLQNFPVLTNVSNNSISGFLNSNASRTYRIEFFANTAYDSSGAGEGEVYLGFQEVTTDGSGNATISFNYTPVNGKSIITATATDLTTGDTSEFSLRNQAPVNNLPAGPFNTNEDTALVFSGANKISISDADTSNNIQVTLNATNGTVALGSTSNVTVTGDNSNTVTVTGSIADINAALNGLSFNPTANYNGIASIQIVTNDQAALELGGALSDTDTLNITVNPFNDAPVLSDTDVVLSAVNEDAGNPTGDVGTSIFAIINSSNVSDIDIDSGFLAGIAITAVDTSNGSWFYRLNDSANWTPLNTVSDSNALLLSAEARIYFKPGANFSGDVNQAITFRAWDQTSGTAGNFANTTGSNNGGTTAFSAATDTAALTVNPINDVPSFTKGIDQSVNEDAGAQVVSNWATNLSAGAANESSQTLTFVVSNDNNNLFSAQPSIDSSGNLTYTPAENANGMATVTVFLKDNGGTANGGVDTSATQTFTITIKPVNDPPSFTKGTNQTIDEDAGAQTIANWATNISPGPADEAGQTVNFQVSNNNNGLFSVQPTIDPTGKLTYTPADNASGTATITVALKDTGGLLNNGVDTSAAQTFTITINPVNDAPSFTGNATLTAIQEDTTNPAGSTISNLFGNLFQDIDTNSSLGGIAVVGNPANSNLQGEWQYSTDSGTNWSAMGTVADDATALALSATTLVRFVPFANYHGTVPDLVVRALDNSYNGGYSNGSTRVTVNASANGGITPIAATTNTLGTSVTAVDDTAFFVINTNDSGLGSLRQAILDANNDAGTETITFTGTPFTDATPDTISLTSGELSISDSVTITGTGADKLTLSGNGGEPARVFDIANPATVTLEGMTIANGNAINANGGGIHNSGNLTVNKVAIRSNTATEGAGIYNVGNLTILNSTLSGNTASDYGGGIANNGTLVIRNSTISGNQVTSTDNDKGGGAIDQFGSGNPTATIENSTIAFNSAANASTSGIWLENGTMSLRNTIVANNNGTNNFQVETGATLTSLGNNLTNSVTSPLNQLSDRTNANARLAPLANNGGTTQTHALLSGSAAINAGNNANAPTTDQRGFTRILSDKIDIGAVEYAPQPDYTSDGKIDLLWRNSSSGANVIWALNGTSYSTAFALPTLTDTNWQLEGTADFTGDGKADLLWRNRSTGANVVWQLNGTGYSTAFALPTLKDTNWQIEGTADFTGDGRADVLWRNYSTGANVVWQLNGTSYSTAFTLPTLKDSNWRIEGVADFTGDGKADILWRHYGNGANVIWLMNGTSYSTAFTLPTQSADWSLWSLAKVADFTGDGKDDLLWRNSTTGANVIWQLNGTSYSTSYALPTLKGYQWTIQGVADLDGNGSNDILWRNSSTGANVIWQLNSTTYSTATALPELASANWVNYL
ncbi:DUF4347 domain-containing protein [Kovacikia minuta CCNUW1]|uniref:DUF4347 domain-containing protein n=1 Tax=Kovacikia minuta TaxID=2931930 RepID=UPI001CCFB5BD|nr:DUF4347 domain-containing protein [Kovacikia minuta]UBF25722.1 DUF4347 domain-containing protein [Kovacikia minuta CCNUW1]